MNEELDQLEAELRSLFVENKIKEMGDLLHDKADADVKELCDNNWNVIKKYYDTERFDLILGHFKYVAYSCYIVEYAHQRALISDEAFSIMMMIYNDIYELKRSQRLDT